MDPYLTSGDFFRMKEFHLNFIAGGAQIDLLGK